MTPPKKKPVNLGLQALGLRRLFPESQIAVRRARLVWTGWLQPTDLSRRYLVRITLGHDGLPHVRVVEPTLVSRPGKQLPHTYREGTLCLYSLDDWTPAMPISQTLVPWASEWLLNYEIWLATGEWYGGGEWPPRRSDPLKSAA